jgi:glucan phosphoethanolaminetransferase (alkaline phosphatase superfamily)
LNDYGFRTSWVSNQDNSPAYSAIIYESDTVIFPNAEKSVFVFNPWYDSSLLPPLDQLMCGNTSKRNLYVLHTIGSHWYYNNHVTTEMQLFQPVTENRIVTDNRHEQVVNSYDNTVLYADMIADSIIQRFEQRCAVVLFISDHGEALGEEGKWLHANNTVAAHYPACFVWYSDKYQAAYPDKIDALKRNKDKEYNTSFLFHSVLDACDIRTSFIKQSENIFR